MVVAIILIFASSSGQMNYAEGEDMSDSTADEIIVPGPDLVIEVENPMSLLISLRIIVVQKL
jgi:hypothetical protein